MSWGLGGKTTMEMTFTPQEGAALYGLLAQDTTDIVVKTDRSGFIAHASPGIARLGIALGDMLVWPHLCDLADGPGKAAVRSALGAALAGSCGGPWVEFAPSPALFADGRRAMRFAMQLRALHDERAEPCGAIGLLRDVGDRHWLEQQLFIAEMTDALTGLTNRRAFMAMLAHLLERPGRHALCLFDIDHFKAINIAHGQAAGDSVLVSFAQYLRAMLRSRDTISRIGGETFAVLLPDTGMAAAGAICEEVVATLAEIGLAANGGGLALTASGGLARVAGSLDATARRAELALFHAKVNGRNRLLVDGGAGQPWAARAGSDTPASR